MKVVNLSPRNSAFVGLGVRRGMGPKNASGRGTRTIQASKTFYIGLKQPAFTVTARKDVYPGRKGDLSVGVYLQAGARYIITLWEIDDNGEGQLKLDGTISTAALGDEKVTVVGICDKINSSAMGAFVTATLHNNASNIDYTGATGVAYADSFPMSGGRG
jgi:hypothetical protein